MAQLTTMARPYAKAAFQTALEDSQLQQWSDSLHSAAAIASDERVSARLSAPSASGGDQAGLLLSLLGDAVEQKFSNFLQVLAENKRLALLPDVVELFDALKAEQEKRVDVKVVSAFALAADTEQKLADALRKRLQREVTLNTTVDQRLIGGLVIHAGDLVIDGSVRGRLNKLAETINA